MASKWWWFPLVFLQHFVITSQVDPGSQLSQQPCEARKTRLSWESHCEEGSDGQRRQLGSPVSNHGVLVTALRGPTAPALALGGLLAWTIRSYPFTNYVTSLPPFPHLKNRNNTVNNKQLLGRLSEVMGAKVTQFCFLSPIDCMYLPIKMSHSISNFKS